MFGRVSIDVQGLIDLSVSDAGEVKTWRTLCDVADELNSALPKYRVSLEHYDTGDYLSFERRDPTDATHWADQQEELEAIKLAMQEGADEPL